MRLIHVPVSLTPDDITKKYRGKELSWWSDNPLWSYDSVMISAYHTMGKIKNRSQIRDDVVLFGDSGGFQILQNILDKTKFTDVNKKIGWQKVIDWQMRFCDIGITLDIPPPRKGNRTYTKEKFDEYLEISTGNAVSAYIYKNNNINELHPGFSDLTRFTV